ncbi:MAG: UDP-N-acetylmuramate dehydrogenase [Thermodesulfobacteriota bacterium]
MDVRGLIRGRMLFHVAMRDITSLKVGGRADILAFPLDEEDLSTLIKYAQKTRTQYHIIGKCTNILVRDGGIRGMLIDLSKGFNKVNYLAPHRVIAEAGASLKRIINLCVEKELQGLEFACGIPGSLGGAIAMNAGAYGGEIKDLVEEIDIMEEDGIVRKIKKDYLDFRYRGLHLENQGVILRAVLKFEKGDNHKIKEQMDSYNKIRRAGQAVPFPNAGSTFKNPPGISAGRLIEELGLKGLKVGDAMISEVHGNYIVNAGEASSQDVLTLIGLVKKKALRERNISLETEIRVVGEE